MIRPPFHLLKYFKVKKLHNFRVLPYEVCESEEIETNIKWGEVKEKDVTFEKTFPVDMNKIRDWKNRKDKSFPFLL